MNITLTGATGFLGRALSARLAADGHALHFAGRSVPRERPEGAEFSVWPSVSSAFPPDALQDADAVIHLAGEPVAQRWNPEVKERIRCSRVEGTRNLVDAMAGLTRRPPVLVCASATGIYGDRGEESLTELSQPGGGFLADVCAEWEEAAAGARRLGARVVSVRTGIVLGKHGGALGKMLLPFRAGMGGKLGAGKQWMPWIHIDDIVEMFCFAAFNELAEGAWNGTAPEPARNEDFTRALAAALHRPAIFPVPRIALTALYGEMAEVLFSSQRVVPEAARRAGFAFRHKSLRSALEAVVS